MINEEGIEITTSNTSLDNTPTPTVEEQENANAPLFTQEQVNEIAGKIRKEACDRTISKLLSKYELESMDDFDNIYGDAQRYGLAKDELSSLEALSSERDAELASLKERIALLESGIDRERFEDASFILKGKGKEVSLENIMGELATHPEWKKEEIKTQTTSPMFRKSTSVHAPVPETAEAVSSKSVLGNAPENVEAPGMSEKDYVMKKLYKL